MGQGTSIALSDALQRTMANTMVAQKGGGKALTTLVSANKAPDQIKQRFRSMNASLREQLIRTALTKNIEVVLGTGSVSSCQLKGAAADVTLAIDTNNLDFWDGQINDLRARQKNRRDYIPEIVLQQADILSFLAMPLPIGPETHPWLRVLLDSALDLSDMVVAEFKNHFAFPRPFRVAPDINPVIQTPSHGSFPSGHATQAFCLATILGTLFIEHEAQLRQIALRIALNRGFAGVHYPVDHYAGAILGEVLGVTVVNRVFAVSARTFQENKREFKAGVNGAPNVEDYVTQGNAPNWAISATHLVDCILPNLNATKAPSILSWLALEVLTELAG